jgi:hypothetical protein
MQLLLMKLLENESWVRTYLSILQAKMFPLNSGDKIGLGFLMHQQHNLGELVPVYLVTNAHVVDGLQVAITDERKLISPFFSTNSKARDGWIDEQHDLAILKISKYQKKSLKTIMHLSNP